MKKKARAKSKTAKMKDLPQKALNAKTARGVKGGWSGPGDEGPQESISIAYGKVGVEYQEQQPSGPTARRKF